jgi:hypothetical protein
MSQQSEEAEAAAAAEEEDETTDACAKEKDETTDAGGDETIDGCAGDGDRTDGSSANPPAKKKKDIKDRTLQVLANISEEFTEVTDRGLPWCPWSLPRVRHATRVHRPGKHIDTHQAPQRF